MIKKLLQNLFSNVSVLVLKMGITFIMSPVIVKALGNYDYGIWEIVFCIVGYMGLLDIGIPTAIVRYTAKYNAENNKEKLEELFSSSLAFMFFMGLLIFLFFLCWIFVLPQNFLEEGGSKQKYIFFLLIIGLQMLFTFPGYVFQSIHEGFQRYNLINLVTIINSVVGAIIIFVLLNKGGGLLTLAIANAAGISLKYTIYWIMLRSSRFGGFRFRIKKISIVRTKELFTFGLKSLIIGISLQISFSTGPLIIGAFLSPVIVTFYVIPSGLVRHACNLISSSTLAFMPVFSELSAKKDKEKMVKLYLSASRYIVGILLPIVAGIYFLGVPFLSRWMGTEYAEKGRYIIYILTIAYTLAYFNPFSNRFLTGIGHQGVLAKLRFSSAVLNLILSLVLVQFFNKEGVAVAALIPALIMEPLILYATCRKLGITVFKYAYNVFFPLILPQFLILFFLWYTTNYFSCKSYSEMFLITVSSAVLYITAFIIVSMKKDERLFVVKKIRKSINLAMA